METTTAKDELLRSAGYLYHFVRMAYVNRNQRKIFSWEAVEDHPEEWIRGKIAEPNPSGDWVFYFSGEPPSQAVAEAILAELR